MNRVLVTLVHGTFGRNSVWTKPGSPFRNLLQEHLREQAIEVQFATSPWSGWNFSSSRLNGARALARHIREANPSGLPHFVVGHSHGGNVIRYALRDLDVARNVTGVVTLATPFIRVDPRPFGPWLSFLLSANATLGYAVCVLVVIALLFGLLIPAISGGELEQVVTRVLQSGFGINFLILPAVAGIYVVLRVTWLDPVSRFVQNLTRRLYIRQTEFVGLLDLPSITGIPVLVCTATADEAGAILRWMRSSTEWFFVVLGEYVLTTAVLFIAVPVGAATGVFYLLGDDQPIVSVTLAILAALLAVPVAASCYLFLILLVPQTIRLLGLGVEGPLQTWLLDFRTSALPEFWAEYKRHEVTLPAYSSILFGQLRHSLSYQAEETIKFCAEWIGDVSQRAAGTQVSLSNRPMPTLTQSANLQLMVPFKAYVAAGYFSGMSFRELATYIVYLSVGQGSEYSWLRTSGVPLDFPAAIYYAFIGAACGAVLGRLEPIFPAKPSLYIVAAVIFGAVVLTIIDDLTYVLMYDDAELYFLSWRQYFVNGAWGLGAGVIVLLVRRGLRVQGKLPPV